MIRAAVVADFAGYLVVVGIALAALLAAGVFVYDAGRRRGQRAAVRAGCDDAVAETVPVLVPAQRTGEQ